MSWLDAELGPLINIDHGYPFDSSRFDKAGDLPVVRIRDIVREYSSTFLSGQCDNQYIVSNGDIFIGMDSNLTVLNGMVVRQY